MPSVAAQVQHGPHDPWELIKHIYHLGPDELLAAFANPRLAGLYLADRADERIGKPGTALSVAPGCDAKSETAGLLRQAAWLRDNCFEEEPLHLSAKYFVVQHFGNKAIVGHWGVGGDLVHQSFDEFRNSHLHRFYIGANHKTGADERLPLARAWLLHPRTPRYERVDFVPGTTQAEMPSHVLNLWRGWRDLSDRTDDSALEPKECARFLEHMHTNMCGGDDDVYDYLLGWMADAVINPHRTSEVAVALRGPQGSGKTLWAKCFAELFAPYTLVLDKPNQVTGNFNSHLMAKCLVFADEAFFAGNKQHAATLKTMVTSDEIFIEPKGVNGFMARKTFRLIMASNDEHVIDAEADDRRYLVLDVNAREHNQDRAYFRAIADEWRAGGKAALFAWLRGQHWRETLDCGFWDVGNRPKTAALTRQKDLSLRGPQLAVYNLLAQGELPVRHETLMKDGRIFVATQLLLDAARLSPKEATALGRLLSQMGEPDRPYLGTGDRRRQYKGYWLRPLPEARAKFEDMLGRSVHWPAHVASWGLDDNAVYVPAAATHEKRDDEDLPF